MQTKLSTREAPSRRRCGSKRPDFFIVGAPKCGTSALTEYLAAHPDIYMARKEMHFFGADLQFGPQFYRRSPQAYLAEFDARDGQLRAGEASVWYLFSREAAAEIKAFNSEARILLMLREPSEMLYSLYHQFRADGNEPLATFQDALKAESARRAGQGLSRQTYFPQGLIYREVALYTDQVRRYFELFGRDQVHVVIYDDFAADPAATYRAATEFLGVDPSYQPESFKVINGNKRVKHPALRAVLGDPLVRGTALAFRPWLPGQLFAVLQRAEARLHKYNLQPGTREPLAPELRAQLRREFAPVIERLSALLDRDLTHWSQ